jgi:tetratricopeptide (TPR) repeat protein
MRALILVLVVSWQAAAPAHVDLRTVLQEGTRLVDSGQLFAAQELYEDALQKSPADPDLRFQLASVYFRQQNWPKAAENYQASLRSDPDRIKSLFYLSEAYFMQSDLYRARETIARAAKLAPDDAQVCQKYGEYLSASVEKRLEGLSWLEKARGLNPNLPHIDTDIGKTQFELTDFVSARTNLQAALGKSPADGQAAFYLAECWAKLGEWENARKYYEYAIAKGYADAQAQFGMGNAMVELGSFQSALQPLQRTLAMQPSLIQAHFQLAKAYRQLGRIKEAQSESRLYSALSNLVDTSNDLKGPEEEEAWRQVKPLLESNKEQQALDLVTKLPIARRIDGDPYYLVGAMYFSMGSNDNAKRLLKLARTRNPTSSRIVAYLGVLELSSGDLSSSEKSFESALTLDPSTALAQVGMGALRYQQQRWAEAAGYLEKSRTADPNTLLMLCDAYLRIGNAEEARVTAEVIRALASDSDKILKAADNLFKVHHMPEAEPSN